LASLRATGKRKQDALADLRAIVAASLPYALSKYIRPSNPRFDPLIQEVAQETLLRVMDRLETFEGRSRLTTWVHTIAVRIALTKLRRTRWKGVSLETYRVHAKDCQDCESDPNAKVTIIEAELAFKGDLSEDQIQRLGEISEHCPVHKTLTSEIKITTTLK
jgi:DNA-directed RNA polymerase specialized sigma24 family protein